MIEFEKWHGLGNDFIVTRTPIEADQAIDWCDRRRGVGADGVLVVDEKVQPPSMVVLNADGSRPEMCGNGLRCVVGFIVDGRQSGSSGTLAVRTDAGVKNCHYEKVGEGAYSVRVEMGQALVGDSMAFEGSPRRFVHVDMGNPHLVSFDPYEEADVDRDGPAINARVEGGSNVEFVRVSEGGRRLDVVVWERGVGRTEACGTGACAVAVAAVAAGKSRKEESLHVELPGGKLDIVVSGPPHQVLMTGPAVRTFRGHA